MKPECPYYIAPRYAVDPKTDKGYESSAICEETDKYCSLEYGQECAVYDEWLEEEYYGEMILPYDGRKVKEAEDERDKV